MNISWRPLLVRLLLGVVAAVAAYFVCTLIGLYLPLVLLLTVGLAVGAVSWILDQGADRADQLHAPELDLDVDYALPHAQDTQVRRLEDLAHGAQPSRQMTGRALARVLGDIADERAHDPAAPELSPGLTRLLRAARSSDDDARRIGAIDRRTLHRCLNELAAREERDR